MKNEEKAATIYTGAELEFLEKDTIFFEKKVEINSCSLFVWGV